MTDTNHNDTTHAALPDSPFPTDESSAHRLSFGEIGVGKTTRLATVLDETIRPGEPTEWIDPKGDPNPPSEEHRGP